MVVVGKRKIEGELKLTPANIEALLKLLNQVEDGLTYASLVVTACREGLTQLKELKTAFAKHSHGFDWGEAVHKISEKYPDLGPILLGSDWGKLDWGKIELLGNSAFNTNILELNKARIATALKEIYGQSFAVRVRRRQS